jgi:hypothetical protein
VKVAHHHRVHLQVPKVRPVLVHGHDRLGLREEHHDQLYHQMIADYQWAGLPKVRHQIANFPDRFLIQVQFE